MSNLHDNNPRARRAFAHSARVKANENPTLHNIADALRHENGLQSGPKRSQAMMGMVACLNNVIGGIRDTHVAFVDWTVVDEDTLQGNVGGVIISRELAEAVHEEQQGVSSIHEKWHEALVQPHRWVAGTPQDCRVKHLAMIGIDEILTFPTQTHDYDGSPRDVASDQTPLAAVMRAALSSHKDSI